MEVYWHTKKEHIDHLRGEVVFDLDNDYLHPRETCTLIFSSADECIKAIKFLYPNATFNLSYNMAYYCGQVCDFDDHLWELKEYRDELNIRTVHTSI